MSRQWSCALVVLALLGAGCAGGDKAPDELGFVESTTTVAPTSSASTADEPLRLGLIEPSSWDPLAMAITSPSDMTALDLLLDGLTQVDADGTVSPALAESWEISDDGLEWTFTLGPDAAVTADDVVWTLTRVAAAGNESVVSAGLSAIVGFDAMAAGDSDELTGVDATSAGVVTIRLDEGFAALPAVLAHPVLGVMPDGVTDIDIASATPVSSHWVVAASDDDGMTLEPSSGDVTAAGAVQIQWVEDAADGADLVDEGEIDAAPGSEEVGEAAVIEGPPNRIDFYGLNVGHPTLLAASFRRAVVQAIDIEALVPEGSDPVSRLVPDGTGEACGPNCGFDPDVAEGLVEFVFGEDRPPALGVDYVDGDDAEAERVEAVIEDLADVGIDATALPGSVAEIEERIANGEHQVFRFGWVVPYDDPQAWLRSLFRSEGIDNVFNLDVPEIDSALAALAAEADDRANLAAAAELEILDQFVVIPVSAEATHWVVGERLARADVRRDGTLALPTAGG